MKKILLAVIALFLLFLFSSCDNEEYTPADQFSYVVTEKYEISITGYTGNWMSVKIPKKIENKPVVEIGKSAFDGNTLIKEVIIPEGVKNIGVNAFRKCYNISR